MLKSHDRLNLSSTFTVTEVVPENLERFLTSHQLRFSRFYRTVSLNKQTPNASIEGFLVSAVGTEAENLVRK